MKGRHNHASADVIPLQLVELVAGDLRLDGHLPDSIDGNRHLAERKPSQSSIEGTWIAVESFSKKRPPPTDRTPGPGRTDPANREDPWGQHTDAPGQG